MMQFAEDTTQGCLGIIFQIAFVVFFLTLAFGVFAVAASIFGTLLGIVAVLLFIALLRR